MKSFGEWKYTVDRETTEKAYSDTSIGGAGTCDCSFCRNFIAARDKVFPGGCLDMLKQLGIDATKDGEVYHLGAEKPGSHQYGGWYHFVGTLRVDGDFAPVEFPGGFIVYMCRKSAPMGPNYASKSRILSLNKLARRLLYLPKQVAASSGMRQNGC